MRLLAALVLLPAALVAQVTEGPRNVVVVVADDLGLQAGCYGDSTAAHSES